MPYICVLDFEATCWEGGENKNSMEIIEFPSILYWLDKENNKCTYVSEFHQYVKPTICPKLSKFCTQLTGIQQSTVDVAKPFVEVYEAHHRWIQEQTQGQPIAFLTCGDWDLSIQLFRELRNKGIKRHYGVYKHYIELKREYEYFKKRKVGGMMAMLRDAGLTLQGRHHSGIDDCRNIARILVQLVEQGHTNFQINRL